MSDLGFSFSIGAALSSTVGASVGSTVKHLDRLGKAAAGRRPLAPGGTGCATF